MVSAVMNAVFEEKPFLLRLGAFVRFSHTVFALPFALIAMWEAARQTGNGRVEWEVFGWIFLCMVGARTGAMCFNRLMDWEIDKSNPRTADRHKLVTRPQAWGVLAVSVAAVFAATWHLNPLCFYLTPLMLVIIGFYSLTKRFTAFSHLFLGLALGVAPIGASLAVSGVFWRLPAFLLGVAVALWTFGFDLIYSTLDVEFDKGRGLYSFPSRYGVVAALKLARALHVAAAAGFAAFGCACKLGFAYWAGFSVALVGLVWEHRFARTLDVGLVNRAFFQINAIVSVALLVGVMIDLRVVQNAIR
jgi:4-hydroxybenzoate polyprenyltransferase